MEANDTISLRDQREMEHAEDLEMIRYYLPVEKKWDTIYKIFVAVVFGCALGNLFNLLTMKKKKRIREIAKEVIYILEDEIPAGAELSESDLECYIKRAMKKLGY